MGRPRTRSELLNHVVCLRATKSAGILDARRLPRLATWLLEHGLDMPSIVDLAGLDLAPFFSIDASEMFDRVVEELGMEASDLANELRIALAMAGQAHLEGHVSAERLLAIGVQLTTENNFPDEPDGLMQLYLLADEWLGEWGRGRDAILLDIRSLAQDAVANSPESQAMDPAFLALLIGGAPDM